MAGPARHHGCDARPAAYDGPVTQTAVRTPTDVALPPGTHGWGPALAGRLLGSERAWSWLGPLVVTAVAGLQRFVGLGTPHALVFDEVYYVKEAASYLRYGVEVARPAVPSGATDPFVLGRVNSYAGSPEFVVHPPVGKWMIAIGEWIFGPASSFGWRFSVALCGTLSVLLLGRIAHRLFGSALLATTASLLLAVDGQEFVHSRTGILDLFIMFWALAGFGCLLIDRDRTRARLARATDLTRWGPWTGPRWWRIAGVLCLTLCTGVKWSGLYFAAAFLTLSVAWDATARRAAGVRRPLVGAAVLDAGQAFVTTAVLLPAGYLATWTGWFRSTKGWDRSWGRQHPAAHGWGWVPDALRSLWHYHGEMWHFNVTLHTPHPYMANPWGWTILARPTAFYYETVTQGHGGCSVAQCSQAVLALGNPLIWWGGTLALAVLAFRWALSRDWRAGAIATGFGAGWLPWFLYQDRTIFQFYAVAFVPWVVLAVTYCLGLLVGPRDRPAAGRRPAVLAAGSYVFVTVLTFWFFYPILAAQVIPHAGWALRMWFPSWI
jgi:dolichyl-phosphate-mannose-protein mannosyltransferase